MKKDDDDFGNRAAFALPVAYFERDAQPTTRSVPHAQAANDGAGDEPSFLEPVAYYETEARPAPRAATHNAGEDEQPFIAPRPYFVSNEMLDLDELRQIVLRAMAMVDRSAAGSADRLAAERQLITARSNLLVAARARASELEAQLAALKQPGADDEQRRRLEAELASVNALLATVEDEPPSKATTDATSNELRSAPRVLNSWRNSHGELVEQTESGIRVSAASPQEALPPGHGEPAEGSPAWYRVALHMLARRASALSDEELAREMTALNSGRGQ